MSPTLTTIPHETLCSVVSYLLLPDQSTLARTCKSIGVVLTPIIWSDIELHHSGTHEGIDIEGEIDALGYDDEKERMIEATADDPIYPYKRLVFESSRRKYAQCHFDLQKWQETFWSRSRRENRFGRATNNCNRRNFQFGREEKFVNVYKLTSRERWAELTQHVRSLCISIGVDNDVAKVLASFRNLRSLELVGLPLEQGHPLTAPLMVFPALQNLKLRGYFGIALVREICSNAEHIKYLDLGLLATAKDDEPYKPNLLANDSNDNRDIVFEQEAEHYQKIGVESAALALQAAENGESNGATEPDNEEQEEWEEEEEEEEDDEEEGEDEEEDDERMPWALHAPIWLPRSLPIRYTQLTHLHLVKPYTGETDNDMSHDHFEHIPHQYEQVLCLEWETLLRGVGGTLQELILEHRIPVEEGDTVGDGDLVPRAKGGNRHGWNPFSSTSPDRGDKLFCRSVLRLLLEQSDRFPKLERLAFRGIQIKGLRTQTGAVEVPGRNGVPDNDERLRNMYPNCDIEIFEDSYPIHVYAGYVYQSWPESRHEAMQDEGDGLMWNLAYYNDYRKRFGPQWHLAG
ncbi:hypothetical protein F5B22DRAFT_457057 [Xylaria bambusicola]|uniref:uncharacterized protein n=1 Tax=Xylaria bambusicola TaxID=326684 RepID=UPI002008C30D|nr:uncharacterized protein F5B22DRAFT_457057 [Xylaria bambusicola]KAI0522049.1 hypothetical protein F5B22DRAFT_457057 [Xylaria bambusicola]